jgi:4-aminobutyrate aminotransferase-like enzyme
MLAVDLGSRPGAAVQVLSRLLERGILVSTGGGQREVVVLTPALNIEQSMLDAALLQVAESVTQVVRS